jgi:hypothetical protein
MAVREGGSAGGCFDAGGTLPQPISTSDGKTATAAARHRNGLGVCIHILVLPLHRPRTGAFRALHIDRSFKTRKSVQRHAVCRKNRFLNVLSCSVPAAHAGTERGEPDGHE